MINDLILNANESCDEIEYYSDSNDGIKEIEIEETEVVTSHLIVEETSNSPTETANASDGNATQSKGRKKNRKDYNIACEICGKTYTKGEMKYHLNSHYGNFGVVLIPFHFILTE